jgi:hypothetical protein
MLSKEVLHGIPHSPQHAVAAAAATSPHLNHLALIVRPAARQTQSPVIATITVGSADEQAA